MTEVQEKQIVSKKELVETLSHTANLYGMYSEKRRLQIMEYIEKTNSTAGNVLSEDELSFLRKTIIEDPSAFFDKYGSVGILERDPENSIPGDILQSEITHTEFLEMVFNQVDSTTRNYFVNSLDKENIFTDDEKEILHHMIEDKEYAFDNTNKEKVVSTIAKLSSLNLKSEELSIVNDFITNNKCVQELNLSVEFKNYFSSEIENAKAMQKVHAMAFYNVNEPGAEHFLRDPDSVLLKRVPSKALKTGRYSVNSDGFLCFDGHKISAQGFADSLKELDYKNPAKIVLDVFKNAEEDGYGKKYDKDYDVIVSPLDFQQLWYFWQIQCVKGTVPSKYIPSNDIDKDGNSVNGFVMNKFTDEKMEKFLAFYKDQLLGNRLIPKISANEMHHIIPVSVDATLSTNVANIIPVTSEQHRYFCHLKGDMRLFSDSIAVLCISSKSLLYCCDLLFGAETSRLETDMDSFLKTVTSCADTLRIRRYKEKGEVLPSPESDKSSYYRTVYLPFNAGDNNDSVDLSKRLSGFIVHITNTFEERGIEGLPSLGNTSVVSPDSAATLEQAFGILAVGEDCVCGNLGTNLRLWMRATLAELRNLFNEALDDAFERDLLSKTEWKEEKKALRDLGPVEYLKTAPTDKKQILANYEKNISRGNSLNFSLE